MVQAKSNREHHELNLRFQQVYKMLQARGIIVSHDRQKSKAKFAKFAVKLINNFIMIINFDKLT